MRLLIPRLWLPALTVLLASPFFAKSQTYAYVANTSSNNVSAFSVNATSGALTQIAGSPFAAGSGPGGVAATPAGRFLYVTNSGSGSISAFAITPATGALTPAPGSPFATAALASGPARNPLAVSASGNYLVVANSGAGVVSVYKIDASTGALTAVPGSPVSAGGSPSSVALSPSGAFVYVANTASGNISAYAMSAATGTLTPVPGSPFAPPSGLSGLSGIAVSPDGLSLYAIGGSTTVTISSLDPITGALTTPAGASFAIASGPVSVVLSPTGQFGYTAQSAGTINGFVTTSPPAPFSSGSPLSGGGTPSAMGMDSAGHFLYAVNGTGGNVSAYSVDAASGALTAITGSPFTCGTGPNGIALASPLATPVQPGVDISAGNLGALSQSGGTISFNTDTLTFSMNGGLSIPGGRLIPQSGTVGIGAFDFSSVSLSGTTITATGSNALAILGAKDVNLSNVTVTLGGSAGTGSGEGGAAGAGGGGGGGGGQGSGAGAYHAGGAGGLGQGGQGRLGNSPVSGGASGIAPGGGPDDNGDGGTGGRGFRSFSAQAGALGGGGGGGGTGGGPGGAWGNGAGIAGAAGRASGGGGGHATAGGTATRVQAVGGLVPGGPNYGDPSLGVLEGGSGGGGGADDYISPADGGGGGGGAIEITSLTSLTVSGTILVTGGNGASGSPWTAGGGGAGGAVRLGAPLVTLSGTIDARGGSGGATSYSSGGSGGLGYVAVYANQLYNTAALYGALYQTTFPAQPARSVEYHVTLNTLYQTGNTADLIGGGSAGPDTGFARITNAGPSTLSGVFSTRAVSVNGADFSFTSPLLTLVPGASASIAVGPESSNYGGFNGPQSAPQPGPIVQFNGAVLQGSFSDPFSFSVEDAAIHSGVFRTNPFGVTLDSWVLQGGDSYGRDTGDAFETTQAPGVMHFDFVPPSTVSSLTVTTDRAAYALGQPVTISGAVRTNLGTPVIGGSVLLTLSINGNSHALSAVTGSAGTYSVQYLPLPSEAGAFQVTATASASNGSASSGTSFRVIGLQLTPASQTIDLAMGNTATLNFSLANLGNSALSAVNISRTSNGPASIAGALGLGTVPSSLIASAVAPFTLAVSAPPGTPPGSPVIFTIAASALDNASGVAVTQTATVTVTLHAVSAALTVSPANSVLGVNPGQSATQAFSVQNTGFGAVSGGVVSGGVVTLTSAPAWVVLTNPSLGNLAAGQTAAFQIVAQPPANTAPLNYPVSFSVTGGASPVAGSLTVNVTTAAVGSVPFHVTDDIDSNVAGATVTLIFTANPALMFQGTTDSAGNLTLNNVPAGAYKYSVTAAQHDPVSGSLQVQPGTNPQVNALMSFNVVTLSFSVTGTTIQDVYNVQLTVTYATQTIKPVLQVTPFAVNCSIFPGALCTQALTIKNLHPTAAANNISIDASRLDLASPAASRFGPHVSLSAPCTVGSPSLATLPSLAGGQSATVYFCGTVSNGNLTTRDLGNINVSATWSCSASAAGCALNTPVPVRYTRPVDVSCDSINLIHDETVDVNDLRPLDSGFVHGCTSARPGIDATFLSSSNPFFDGHELVAFAQVNSGSTNLLTMLANTPIWRSDFHAATAGTGPVKSGIAGATPGDTGYFSVQAPGQPCGGDLIGCLKSLLGTSSRSAVLSNPLYAGFAAQWADRALQGPDGYLIPINIQQVRPSSGSGGGGGGGSGGGGGGGGTGGSVYWPCAGCYVLPGASGGIVKVGIDQQLVFERQAFNATLGVAPVTALSNVHTALVVRDSSNQDASSKFTIVLTGDPNGATSGGTLSSANLVTWQLIPKAGAGGSNGSQYTVSATFSWTLNGQNFSTGTNAVTIGVTPNPMLQVTYSVPFVIVPNKDAKIGVSVTNTGGGPARNFSVSSAQPRILDNPNGLPVGFSVTGSSTTSGNNNFQAGQLTIPFGNVASGQTAAGYFGFQSTARGYIVDLTATLTEQDYLGAKLDPVITLAPVVFVPALGGHVTAANGVANGLVVTATDGVHTVTDTTDQNGNYFLPDIAVTRTLGTSYTITVATTAGTALASQTVNVLPDQSTPFVDFSVTLPAAGPVKVTVTTMPAGLQVVVDGVTYTAPASLTWQAGSPHTVTTPQYQGNASTRYAFGSWSTGDLITQSVTAPISPVTYTASFITQYYLNVASSPLDGGIVNCVAGPACPFAPPGFYPAGATLSLAANANTGYTFSSFSGAVSGTTNPATLQLNAPAAVTANFSPIAPLLSPAISARTGAANARVWTFTFTNNGIGVGNGTQIASLSIVPVGSPGCATPPRITQPSALSSASPLPVGDIGPLGAASANVTIDFSGCQATTRFSVGLNYRANGGSYSNSATFNNQFR